MKKYIIGKPCRICAAFAALCAMLCIYVSPAMASDTVYTFKDINLAKPSGLEDCTDLKLTSDISVTTSGNQNYKAAGVTTLEKNKELGFYPISEGFTYDGTYLFLGAGSTNNGSVFTLTLPTIPKNSRVTLTVCKPVITNNGGSRRNAGDPYAYFKIGSRCASINGDNFDTWQTLSINVSEDTNTIEFYADKWGAVMISEIKVESISGNTLHSLNITSSRYANVTVNNVKYFADADGSLSLPDFAEGETVNISAQKDGYKTNETEITVGIADEAVSMPLECETDAVYYESDFGNSAGTLYLNDESFDMGGITLESFTEISSNLTFDSNGGKLELRNSAGDAMTTVSYTPNEGIYLNDTLITSKDNMEFKFVLDRKNSLTVVTENGVTRELPLDLTINHDALNTIYGSGVTIDYIGVRYPDASKITIVGPDKVSRIAGVYYKIHYSFEQDYDEPYTSFNFTSDDIDLVFPTDMAVFGETPVGNVTLSVQSGSASAAKNIEICDYPALSDIESSITADTMNIGSVQTLEMTLAYDPYGNEITENLFKNFKSSDESVLTVDESGKIRAVGIGTAAISANAYTGVDNPYSVTITVDSYYIDGSTNGGTAYELNTLTENDNISSYSLTLSDGTVSDIAVSEIPAYKTDKAGLVFSPCYDDTGKLFCVKADNVSAGDTVCISGTGRTVYFYDGTSTTELTEANTTTRGFEINAPNQTAYEIAPVYTFKSVGDVKDEGKTFDADFTDGLYNITFKKAETMRADIYVNGYMVGNNVDQADADRKVSDGNLYTAEDIKLSTGSLNVSMTDGSTLLDYVTVTKKPEFTERKQRVYIIGDSLACEYYGSFEQEVGGGRSGWGQQLGSFLNIPVTNLANSGQFAAGLYRTAFPSVIANGEENDILLIECAYNDRNYSNREEMTTCVKSMIEECRKHGIIPILVTPNASRHDYKPSVAWSSYLKDIAVDTECRVIDLSKESYDFLCSLYGDDSDNVVTMNYNLTAVGGDTLHSSYAGAMKWAAMIAQGLYDFNTELQAQEYENPFDGIVNTDFKYTFTDTLGNTVTAEVEG